VSSYAPTTVNKQVNDQEDKQENKQNKTEESKSISLKHNPEQIVVGYIQDNLLIVKLNKKRTFKIPLSYYPQLEQDKNKLKLSDDRQSIFWEKIDLTITIEDVLELGEKISSTKHKKSVKMKKKKRHSGND